jgi:glycosyltransferase involved in cell wall biosynthesis
LISIAHIITGLNVGGAERALYTLLTGGLNDGLENRVISLMGEGHYGPLLREAGIPVTCLNMRRGLPTPRVVMALRRAMRVAPSDIVQGWMYHGNLAASLVMQFKPKPAHLAWNIRLSLENLENLKRSTRLAIRAGAALSRRPDAIFYNSQRACEQHQAAGYAALDSHVIPNGFDAAKWQPNAGDRAKVRAELGLDDTDILLGFVGRNNPQKDIPNFLRALASVMPGFSQLHVMLVGRGLTEGQRSLIDALPQDRVHLLGERHDVPALLRGLDVFCLSSESEGFPNVIGEAMCTGIPCVTTDVGDAATIVDGTGWIAPPRDATALAEAITTALALPPHLREAQGAAARERIIDLYSIDAIVGRYRLLYRSLMETN